MLTSTYINEGCRYETPQVKKLKEISEIIFGRITRCGRNSN